MKKLCCWFCILLLSFTKSFAQEYFTIDRYEVNVKVNKDASLDIDEMIDVRFTSERHGIIRFIPKKYHTTKRSADGSTSSRSQYLIIDDIDVKLWKFTTSNEGNYKVIKIGSPDNFVWGHQQYHIHYRLLNAIDFVSDHAVLYYNLIGNEWNTSIDQVYFSVQMYKPLPATPSTFIATGAYGSTENKSLSEWKNGDLFTGQTTGRLAAREGVTVGIRLPKGFLDEPNYLLDQLKWLLLPLLVFGVAYMIFLKKGKDARLNIQEETYPPRNMHPSLAGYLIDNSLNRRDLLCLIPYWGAKGHILIEQAAATSNMVLVKLQELPSDSKEFEKTLFNGIFSLGDRVRLSNLQNELYKIMDQASRQLKAEIDAQGYYEQGSISRVTKFIIAGVLLVITGVVVFMKSDWPFIAASVSFLLSAVILFIIGARMSKKTPLGFEVYQQLAGFRAFLQTVDKDRLDLVIKKDPQYLELILPYAIAFKVIDSWAGNMEISAGSPPQWYRGNVDYLSTGLFLSSFNQSMSDMSTTFYSSPQSSSSSSSSSGGSSGGGSGGGGGSSW